MPEYLGPVLDAALQAVKGLDEKPAQEDLVALGERYRPYRSVATQLFWHYYLNR